jgi:hypothetical protein
MKMFNRTAWMLVPLAALVAGCAHDDGPEAPVARVDEPIGVQMMRAQPELRNQRFNNLLSFESPNDMVFVSGASPRSVERDSTRAHTGRSSVRVSDGVLAIKLSSLVKPGTFPGSWTLAGAYFYSPSGAEMSISCQLGGAFVAQRKLTLPPGRWTAAMVDVALLSEMKALVEPGALSGIMFQVDSDQPVWCDDFCLIDNARILYGSETAEPSLDGDWLIRQRGLNYEGAAPGRFTFKLLSAEHSTIGWKPDELNRQRVRFSSSGPQKMVTVYSDGRAYWDGEYRPLSASTAEPQFRQSHYSPGRIEVSEQFGRVDRNTPGDADNDGYNECRGSYEILATGPRLEVVLAPRSSPVVRPVLSISGLPPGNALVSVEGKLIENTTRLEDGTLLIDVPAKINRATTISVNVQ